MRPTRSGLRIPAALIVSVVSHAEPWEPWPFLQSPGTLPTITMDAGETFTGLRHARRYVTTAVGAWKHARNMSILWDSKYGHHVVVYPYEGPLENVAACAGPLDVNMDLHTNIDDVSMMMADPHDWNEDGVADAFDVLDYLIAWG